MSRTDKEQIRTDAIRTVHGLYRSVKGNKPAYDALEAKTQNLRRMIVDLSANLGFAPDPTFYIPAFEAGPATKAARGGGRPSSGGRRPSSGGGGSPTVTSGMTFKALTPTLKGKVTAAGITPAQFDANPIGLMKRLPAEPQKKDDLVKKNLTPEEFLYLRDLGWSTSYLRYGEPVTALRRTRWYKKQGWVDENWVPKAGYKNKIKADIANYQGQAKAASTPNRALRRKPLGVMASYAQRMIKAFPQATREDHKAQMRKKFPGKHNFDSILDNVGG